MMYILGDNIISSLGFSTAENYEAVCFGRSGLRYYSDKFDLPEPFYSSLIEGHVKKLYQRGQIMSCRSDVSIILSVF